MGIAIEQAISLLYQHAKLGLSHMMIPLLHFSSKKHTTLKFLLNLYNDANHHVLTLGVITCSSM
jgi:hypothetical protein